MNFNELNLIYLLSTSDQMEQFGCGSSSNAHVHKRVHGDHGRNWGRIHGDGGRDDEQQDKLPVSM